jgi:hypothetical protein
MRVSNRYNVSFTKLIKNSYCFTDLHKIVKNERLAKVQISPQSGLKLILLLI